MSGYLAWASLKNHLLPAGGARRRAANTSLQARALASLGFVPEGIRAHGFAISSMLAGVAGVLAAQHMQFVSPELMVWTASGEVLVVLILGGIGSLSGAVIGAAGFVLLKHWAAGWTDHWHLAIGALLIVVVLAGGRGLSGLLEGRRDA